MKANYHTHTFRCHHGEGDERACAEHAIASGFSTLGFSEHAPYRFLHGYTSWFHLQPDELEPYIEAVLAVREEYRGRLQILLGIEAEYYPETFDRLLEDLRPYPIDYMILGQHAFGNEYDGPGTYPESDSPELLTRYVDTCIAGLKTGVFSYLAHPDMFSFSGPDELYREEAGRLCTYCAENGIPMEINMRGVLEGKRYPNEKFFQIAKEYPCTFITGLDAHTPQDIVQPETYPRYNELLAKTGITVTDGITLTDPFAVLRTN